MGQLNLDYLNAYSKHTNVFVETGTYQGDSVQTAVEFGFKELHSIELSNELYQACQLRFKNNPLVHLHNGDSPNVLKSLMSRITTRCTFWLDAHYSYSLNTPGSTCYGPNPMLHELDAISTSLIKDHVIFIDDCRLFGSKSWNYLSKESVLEKLFQINPNYQLEYLSGRQSFGFVNPTDDILVAYI